MKSELTEKIIKYVDSFPLNLTIGFPSQSNSYGGKYLILEF